MMRRPELFHLDRTYEHDPAVAAWFMTHREDLDAAARRWWDVIRGCGDEVREVLHDGCPTACLGTAAFAYVNVFAAHVAVGFFDGSELPDPAKLLEGSGKYMRHVKLSPERPVDEAELLELVRNAWAGTKDRVERG